jgi:transposase InsO family protein
VSRYHCSCGFAIDDPDEFGDHYRLAFAPDDDIGTDRRTLEFELRSLRKFATRAAARPAVAAWIEDYNHVRRHSALGMRSPVDYERSLAGKDAA